MGEWGRLFEHRPECRKKLGRPWVQKSPSAIGLSRFLQTGGCAKQKSLQRPPTIRFTNSVCIEDGYFDNFCTVW